MSQSPAPMFSIVTPLYNVADCVERLLTSLRNQTFRDFEVLLMDDGSGDATVAVCTRLTENDNRFRVVENPRRGKASFGRNDGLRLAVGRYVLFLDGDDWIRPESLEYFDQAARRHNFPDLLCAGAVTATGAGEPFKYGREVYNLRAADGEISGLRALELIKNAGRQLICYSCLQVCRREFLLTNKLFQNTGIGLLEDHVWLPQVFFAAERVVAIDFAYYCYWRRPGTLSAGANAEALRDVARSTAELVDFFANHREKMSAAVQGFWANHALNSFFWYFFNPLHDNRFSAREKKIILREFLREPAMRRELPLLFRRASLLKRVSGILLLLTRAGWDGPARLFFRRIYYPLISRKG